MSRGSGSCCFRGGRVGTENSGSTVCAHGSTILCLERLDRTHIWVIRASGVAGIEHVGVLCAFAGVVAHTAAIEQTLDGCDAGVKDTVESR